MENKDYKILNNNSKNNKRNKGRLNFISIAMLVIIISSGMILFCEKFVFGKTTKLSIDTIYNKNGEEKSSDSDNKKPNANNSNTSHNSNKTMKVVIRQYGAYSSEKNAKDFMDASKLNGKYIVKQMDLYKIMGEIYLEGNYELIMEKYKYVNTTKTELLLDNGSKASQYCCEIVNGVLQILNKFTMADVEFVESLSLKTWTKNLVEDTKLKSDANYEEIIKLKKYVDDLPGQVKQENLNLLYQSLYSIITNY